ncbi:MAG: hypothetical protein ACK4YP_27165 [Myxococcota bacterium]
MRLAVLVLLAGCGPQDTAFSNGNGDPDLPTGTGRMEIDQTEITVQNIDVGYSKSAQFTITSVGDANLLLYEIRVVTDVDDVFYFDEVEDVELAPEQSATYSVVADLEVDAPSVGELRIRTNDPDYANLIVPLNAWPEGYVPPEDTGGGGDTGADTGEDTASP